MRTTITKEIEVITCDICNEKTEYAFKCQVCGRDTCGHCAAYNMCIECWEDNCSFANITSKATLESGYGARSNTTTIICHESDNKWRNLLARFHGKRVKITIEEFPKHEEFIGITEFDSINRIMIWYNNEITRLDEITSKRT